MEIKGSLQIPTLPNFLRLKLPFQEETICVDVADLNEDQLEVFVTQWETAFREHVEKRRALRAVEIQSLEEKGELGITELTPKKSKFNPWN